MQPETRRASLTKLEASLAPSVPVEERRETLAGIADQRPDQDTMAAVITLLVDPDDGLRVTAETMLAVWGQYAVTALLQALRSTQPLEVPYRLAIIRQLSRMGTNAARAETLLRSLKDDPNVGAEAEAAVKEIRRDFDDLVTRFGQAGIELFLLAVVVAAPMIAIRKANPNQAWPPVGLVIGFGALAVAGLLLARYLYAGDLLPDRESDGVVSVNRWKLYVHMGLLGVGLGVALGILMASCGGFAQRLFGN